MSGGSFNYLCHAELTERKQTVMEMRDELHRLGYHDAALATDGVVAAMNQIEAAQRNLADVWHAVEWLCSCDWDEDSVAEVLAKWRAAGGVPPAEKVDIAQRLWELEVAARELRAKFASAVTP